MSDWILVELRNGTRMYERSNPGSERSAVLAQTVFQDTAGPCP
jgi:hypothetical protein